jgi:hypothetical protein
MTYLRHVHKNDVEDVKRSPDMLLVLAASFALGLLLTLVLPAASGPTVAAPASPLQAGVISAR